MKLGFGWMSWKIAAILLAAGLAATVLYFTVPKAVDGWRTECAAQGALAKLQEMVDWIKATKAPIQINVGGEQLICSTASVLGGG